MNNKDFINSLASRMGMNAKDVQKRVSLIIDEMANQMDDETAFAIQGFGTFEIKKKTERIVVNPATKQRKLIPPKLVLSFKPSPSLKDKIQ